MSMIIVNIKFAHKIIFAIIGFIGLSLIFLLTYHYGIGLSPDSVAYISVARHISDGSGFINYDGNFFLLQPPLYPLLLSAIEKVFFISPLVSAGCFNAILLGLIVYYSGLFLSIHLKSMALAIIGTVYICFSIVLIKISLIALSDPLFILFVLLYLFYFDRYITHAEISNLLLFSTAAALACLTRYVGIIIILTGTVSIFIWNGKTSKKMLRDLAVFIIITTLPLGVWILRNYLLSHTFFGQRAESSYTLFDNLIFIFNTFIKWFLPLGINELQLFVLAIILFLFILTTIILIHKRNKKEQKLNQIAPILVFILFYSAIIAISSTTTAYDKISDRLLSPIFVPTVFIIFLALDNILKWLSKNFHQKLIPILFFTLIILGMIYPTQNTIYNIEDYAKQSGWEFSSKMWKDNSVIKYLNNHIQFGAGYSFYSNVPEAIYILTNKEAKWSPPKTFYNSPRLIKINANTKSIWEGKNKVCLVWFNNTDRSFLFTIDELKKSTNLVNVVHLKDGEIDTIQF
jgi:Dolichyl-phosphate-mannose-protein mannosyltransferase